MVVGIHVLRCKDTPPNTDPLFFQIPQSLHIACSTHRIPYGTPYSYNDIYNSCAAKNSRRKTEAISSRTWGQRDDGIHIYLSVVYSCCPRSPSWTTASVLSRWTPRTLLCGAGVARSRGRAESTGDWESWCSAGHTETNLVCEESFGHPHHHQNYYILRTHTVHTYDDSGIGACYCTIYGGRTFYSNGSSTQIFFTSLKKKYTAGKQ